MLPSPVADRNHNLDAEGSLQMHTLEGLGERSRAAYEARKPQVDTFCAPARNMSRPGTSALKPQEYSWLGRFIAGDSNWEFFFSFPSWGGFSDEVFVIWLEVPGWGSKFSEFSVPGWRFLVGVIYLFGPRFDQVRSSLREPLYAQGLVEVW